MGMEHEAWIEELIGADTRRTASSKAGMSESTLSRQISRGTIRPEMVIALCRAYGRKPVDGLVETGYLQPWEVEGVGVDAALDKATNNQLLGAVMRRSDPEATYLFGLDEEVINPEMDNDGNVVGLPTALSQSNEQGHPTDDDVHPDWEDHIPHDAVADTSPDEDTTLEDFEP